jgi:kynurenine formamidase
MRWLKSLLIVLGMLGSFVLGRLSTDLFPWEVRLFAQSGDSAGADAGQPGPKGTLKGWTKGKGWGPWDKDDEVGALNALTAETTKAALGMVKKGKVYDLGVNYDAESFRWPGHNPGAIMTFRNPEGIFRQKDNKAATDPKLNPDKVGWHSCALFISDNVATQLDGLGHITAGEDYHWYNGFKEAQWGGNFGIRKCDATTIPPIITRGVMIDVAGFRDTDALPAHYEITPEDLKAALEKQKTKIQPGDAVFIRTGTLKYWGDNGSDHEKIKQHDTAGINLAAAKWLVEQQGAILVGSDTSGLEHSPGPGQKATFIPVHKYLLVDQGVHIGEFHNFEEMARDGVYEFCYICLVARVKGATAGFCLRPVAIH